MNKVFNLQFPERVADTTSRKRAREIIEWHLNKDEPLERESLEELYAYFVGFTPKKASSVFEYVASFSAPRDADNRLNRVYSDGERLAASDGFTVISLRMDSEDAQIYTAGVYCRKSGQRVSDTESTDIPFEDLIERFFESKSEHEFSFLTTRESTPTIRPGNEGVLHPVEHSNLFINSEFLSRTLVGGKLTPKDWRLSEDKAVFGLIDVPWSDYDAKVVIMLSR